MENQEHAQKSLDQLTREREDVAKKITDLDAKGEKNDEWNQLHNKHEELTRLIEEMPNADEQHHEHQQAA